jgi:hypothetical protein
MRSNSTPHTDARMSAVLAYATVLAPVSVVVRFKWLRWN